MGKKVISFSLYGKYPDYTLGAIANARQAKIAYPGWVCRFYVADDVPKGVISRLKDYGAEIINMGRRVGHEAMFWRFLATFEPENEITIIRDADSRFTKCELVMVKDWLASGKKFHVMRWDYSYEVSVLGGLWGLRGNISELREPLERCLESTDYRARGSDQRFLNKNLTPKMKGNVYVNHYIDEWKPPTPLGFFVEETLHPFPLPPETRKILNMPKPIGMMVPSGRKFIVLSIYKNTPLYEYFLAQLIGNIEKRDLFRLERKTISYHFKSRLYSHYFRARFYVADDIRPDLIERLRRLGQVILRPAETAHKDDPEYWKLSILSEKGLGMAVIVGFWEFFFLARRADDIRFRELLPSEPTETKSRAKIIHPLSVCGPDIPVANIDRLVAQRNPDESYQKFIRSTVYPMIPDVRMAVRLRGHYYSNKSLRHWTKMLLPSNLYTRLSRIKKYLKVQMQGHSQDT